MRKLVTFITIFIAVFLVLFLLRTDVRDLALEWEKNGLPEETRIPFQSETPLKPVATASIPPLARQVNLAVPFMPQAPFGNWELPYQEACEETSAILVDKFYKNEPITAEAAKNEILKLVEWQKQRLGYYFHTTAAETAMMLKQYFGYKRVDILRNITIDDIKSHLLAGRPIIVPLAGRMLDNPYYTQPGPIYHMLIIKGFTKDGKFITNDVGTKRGQNYAYDEKVLFNAIHDAPTGGDGWAIDNVEEYVKTGGKTIVVVYPN
ncbi:MAG: C39 family peptidase [Candidatus Yanofskybacteria bacterium]|nr:C39 family peptidase [Candidatus Yanofskybacteria bacterium]